MKDLNLFFKGPKGAPGVPVYNDECIFYALEEEMGKSIPVCDYSKQYLSGCECSDCPNCVTNQMIEDNLAYIKKKQQNILKSDDNVREWFGFYQKKDRADE